MITLEGSCHCGKVKFSVKSHTPEPYMRCYCSICRKTQGGGGYAINVMGEAKTLKLKGEKHLSVYRVRFGKTLSSAHRHFCKHCGSALFVRDPQWPQWIYPFASAIDKGLPKASETAHIMLDSKASWVPVERGGKRFKEYPDQSIEDWHKTRGLYEK